MISNPAPDPKKSHDSAGSDSKNPDPEQHCRVAVTLARPLHVSKVGKRKKGKTKQATLISDFHARGSFSSLWPIRLARNCIYDVTIHPSRSSRINPTLKVCEHNRVAHASPGVRHSVGYFKILERLNKAKEKSSLRAVTQTTPRRPV